MTCPFDHSGCGGVSGFLFGDLPCWECWCIAHDSWEILDRLYAFEDDREEVGA